MAEYSNVETQKCSRANKSSKANVEMWKCSKVAAKTTASARMPLACPHLRLYLLKALLRVSGCEP